MKTIISILLSALPCLSFGINVDTLRCDSLMQTTGIRVTLKSGTAYKTNARGIVIEGTPAQDVDLWTTGPLVFFSNAGAVKWDSHGRATQGILSTNILASCTDLKFREFCKGTRIFFDSEGLVYRGTLNESIAVTIGDETIASSANSPIEFYGNGKIKHITPSLNFKFVTRDGQKVIIASGSPIKLSENGELLEATLGKRLNTIIDGFPTPMSVGHKIKFSREGEIVE